jgi:Ca2+-binding EF-hand superfamily protein
MAKTDTTQKFWNEKIQHLFYLYDADGDGTITPRDFEILTEKLSTLIGQDDVKRREAYADARKKLCAEIMRADANKDGKVTLEEWVVFHKHIADELRKPDTDPELLKQLDQRVHTAFSMLDLNQDGFIVQDEWVKTCHFFGVDQGAAEKSFQQLAKDGKIKEDKAKSLFFEYIKNDDPNHISNCCLCFL